MTESVIDLSPAQSANVPAALAAAEAVLGFLPVGEAVRAGDPIGSAPTLDGDAVTVRFSGSTSGELLIAVDRPVLDALAESPLGPIDPAQAFAPALEAAAGTLGRVALGPAQVLPIGPAFDSVLAKPGALVVPLVANGQVRAAVGLVLVADTAAPAAIPSIDELAAPRDRGRAVGDGAGGLDLLRGVEMDVTAELGRTRMTLSELLGLSDGAVIELDRAAGAPADLLVNGRLIARGEVVVIDENFGLRITEIISEHGGR